MMIIIAAMALGAGQPAPADAHSQPGQMSGMDMSQMDHSKMDHMAKNGGGCCKHKADAKMDCCADDKTGADSNHRGHSGR